jgi:dienelactone hydrolase
LERSARLKDCKLKTENCKLNIGRRDCGRFAARFACGVVLFILLTASHAADPVPVYPEHQDLTYYLDAGGSKHAIKSIADSEIRRQHILGNMQSVMGPLPDRTKLEPLDVRQLEETTLGDVVRRKIEYTTEPDYRLRAYLFLPLTPSGKKLPAVLCLHQTVKIGKQEPAGLGGNPNLHYALHLAQHGYVTLAPDYPSFGEREYDFDPKQGYVSGTMKAIWDNMRGIDLLQSLAYVDPERIGCIGHSLGGHNTMFTAAFDMRITALVSNCGFTRFHKYYNGKLAGWTSPRYMPRIASVYDNDPDKVPFDFTEIVAAFAPRPFLASSPVRDDNFEVSGVRDVIAIAKPIYSLYGKPDNLQANYPESAHDFPADARDVAYGFFDKHLK